LVGVYSQIRSRVVVILNSLLEEGHFLVVKKIGILIFTVAFGMKVLPHWVCLSST
jgi:hypothetical protein